MRILVTGGLGFIGSNFILKLLNENNEYDVINNALRRKAEKLGLLKEYRTLPIEWEIKVTIGDTK